MRARSTARPAGRSCGFGKETPGHGRVGRERSFDSRTMPRADLHHQAVFPARACIIMSFFQFRGLLREDGSHILHHRSFFPPPSFGGRCHPAGPCAGSQRTLHRPSPIARSRRCALRSRRCALRSRRRASRARLCRNDAHLPWPARARRASASLEGERAGHPLDSLCDLLFARRPALEDLVRLR